MRFLDEAGLVPVVEAKDYGSAGIDGDSFRMDHAASFALLVNFGAITGSSTLLIYAGATAGAKSTALPFRYRQSQAVFKAATLADQYATVVYVPATGLTLTDATFKNTTLVIDLDASEIGIDAQPWITVSVSAVATVLLMSALAALELGRFVPAVTAIA